MVLMHSPKLIPLNVQEPKMKNYYEEEARSEWSTYLQKLEEEKKREKKELQQRMSDAYQKRQRQKKISKLQNSQSHWTGLS